MPAEAVEGEFAECAFGVQGEGGAACGVILPDGGAVVVVCGDGVGGGAPGNRGGVVGAAGEVAGGVERVLCDGACGVDRVDRAVGGVEDGAGALVAGGVCHGAGQGAGGPGGQVDAVGVAQRFGCVAVGVQRVAGDIAQCIHRGDEAVVFVEDAVFGLVAGGGLNRGRDVRRRRVDGGGVAGGLDEVAGGVVFELGDGAGGAEGVEALVVGVVGVARPVARGVGDGDEVVIRVVLIAGGEL